MTMQTFEDDELTDIKPDTTPKPQVTPVQNTAAVAAAPAPTPVQATVETNASEDFEDEPSPAAASASAQDDDNLDADFDDERIYHRPGQLNQCRPDKNLKAVRFGFIPPDWVKPKSAKTHFLKGLGKEGKMGRFRCLSPLGSDDQEVCCLGLDKDGEVSFVALVVHYLNADPEGKYRKGPNGELPPINWELKFVRLGAFNMKQIKKLPDEDSTVFDIDIIMSMAEGKAFGYDFSRAQTTARWKKNPELVAEIKQACQRFVDGKVLVQKLGKKLTPLEWKTLLSGSDIGAEEVKLGDVDAL